MALQITSKAITYNGQKIAVRNIAKVVAVERIKISLMVKIVGVFQILIGGVALAGFLFFAPALVASLFTWTDVFLPLVVTAFLGGIIYLCFRVERYFPRLHGIEITTNAGEKSEIMAHGKGAAEFMGKVLRLIFKAMEEEEDPELSYTVNVASKVIQKNTPQS